MRRIFIVLAKLIGLLQLYWGLTYLASIPVFMGQMTGIESNFGGGFLAKQVGGLLCYALISFAMAWLMLARTDWLAGRLNIQTDDQFPVVSDDVVLKAGIKIVGVYILVHAIPSLVKSVADSSSLALEGGWFRAIMSNILSPLLRAVISLLLLIRTEMVLSLIARGEKADGKRILTGGLALLALLILLVLALTTNPYLQTYSRTSDVTTYSDGPVYRSLPKGDTEGVVKDKTPSASHAGDILYDQAMTNRVPAFTTSNIEEFVFSLKQESVKTDQAPSVDSENRIRKMGLIDDRKKDDRPIPAN